MLPVSPLDKQLGIEVYATKSLGVGGVIREAVDDFVVEEVLVDGSKASVNGAVAGKVLGSTLQETEVFAVRFGEAQLGHVHSHQKRCKTAWHRPEAHPDCRHQRRKSHNSSALND